MNIEHISHIFSLDQIQKSDDLDELLDNLDILIIEKLLGLFSSVSAVNIINYFNGCFIKSKILFMNSDPNYNSNTNSYLDNPYLNMVLTQFLKNIMLNFDESFLIELIMSIDKTNHDFFNCFFSYIDNNRNNLENSNNQDVSTFYEKLNSIKSFHHFKKISLFNQLLMVKYFRDIMLYNMFHINAPKLNGRLVEYDGFMTVFIDSDPKSGWDFNLNDSNN